MPSPEAVEQALDLIRKRPANYEYFFSKLNSADWIGPLKEKKLFSSPPQAIRDGDTISFPVWPESQFLARVASQAPDQVAEVIMDIPETDNVRVHHDLACAAAKLPGNLAASWARKEAKWIRKQEYLYFLLPEVLGVLIAHLACSGETRVALKLARAVLTVRPAGAVSSNASALFDHWNYEQLLQEHFPVVIQHARLEGLKLLIELLGNALSGESTQGEDYSWIWRPAIEPHEQNHGYGDLRDILVDAVRDGAEQLLGEGVDMPDILLALSNPNRPVFKRIALHLLAKNREHAAAMGMASDRENFFNDGLRHEYFNLLKAVFSKLSEAKRDDILSWIDEGPSFEDEGGEGGLEIGRMRKAAWQAQRLVHLQGQLPQKWEGNFSKIVSDIGEPEHPEFACFSTSFCGFKSPKEVHDLEGMAVEEIAAFIKSWSPSQDWDASRPEGLGRTLEAVVAKNPNRFANSLTSFRNEDPTYARSIVRGFEQAAKAESKIEWESIVDFLYWIAEQPRNKVFESTSKLDRDPHWGWARKAVVDLLSIGFDRNLIDIELRERVWEIVAIIAEDPDPETEDSARSTMEPMTWSINTTRGEALHAVVRYSLWVYREANLEASAQREAGRFEFNVIPEVRECLERHLDPDVDPSPAIRAVFGHWFPWLQLLDGDWTAEKVESIFPSNCRALQKAAWHAYLAGPAFDAPFCTLREQYKIAVNGLNQDYKAQEDWLRRTGENLGRHLMVMVGRGLVVWNDGDGLLPRFFDNASTSNASHAIAYVGRALERKSSSISATELKRFRQLWESLASHVLDSPSERHPMLKPFGWWFASGRFDLDWSFEQIGRVIEGAEGIDPDFLVMERIAELAVERPAQSLVVFKALVKQEKRGRSIMGRNDFARSVLRAGLDEAETKAEAESLIHELGSRGNFQFRDLLRPDTPLGNG